MVKPIDVNRAELSMAELRAVAPGMRDGAAVRRMLAIAMVLEGYSRAEAARRFGQRSSRTLNFVDGPGTRSANTNPSRSTIFPRRIAIGSANIGPAETKV